MSVSAIRLTPLIKQELLRAHASGRPVTMCMQANQEVGGTNAPFTRLKERGTRLAPCLHTQVVLTVDGQQHTFSSAPEHSCDLVQLPQGCPLPRGQGGEQQAECTVMAPVRSRIQIQVGRMVKQSLQHGEHF